MRLSAVSTCSCAVYISPSPHVVTVGRPVPPDHSGLRGQLVSAEADQEVWYKPRAGRVGGDYQHSLSD